MASTSEVHNADCPPNYEVNGGYNEMTSLESPKEEKIELKKLDFEVIEIDDDDDFDIEESIDSSDTDISTNDEMLFDGTERNAGCENGKSYQGADPLGLLKRINVLNTSRNDWEGESGDELNDVERSHLSLSEIWQLRMKRWPWFLHQDNDGDFAFCLYCNVIMNIRRNQKRLQQHNLSVNHQERAKNYLEFLESDDYKEKFDENHEVKYDFGTDNYVSAMKEKRKREVETLSNYNWKRWMSSHAWLKRHQQEKTIGFCRYCNIHVNVEFKYLRDRHEYSIGHCKAKQDHKIQKRTHTPNQKDDVDRSENDSPTTRNEQSTTETSKGYDAGSAKRNTDDKFEKCRCTLCDYHVSSQNRNANSKLVATNLLLYNDKQKQFDRGIWARYAEQHPWLVADPDNPNLAYCNVCCRRFVYGHSEIKRKIHEQSEHHLAGVAAAYAESGNRKEAAQTWPEQSEVQLKTKADTQDNNELTTKKSNQKDYIEKKKEAAKPPIRKPVVTRYSWLYSKDRKTRICKVCHVRFRNQFSKIKHFKSPRHKQLVRQYKTQQLARQKEALKQKQEREEATKKDEESSQNKDKQPETSAVERKPTVKSAPSTMLGKVMAWKKIYPWVSYRRNGLRDNYGWCNLCDVPVFMPSINYALKHQRSPRHRTRFQQKRGMHVPYFTRSKSAAMMETGETKPNPYLAQLYSEYNWMQADYNDENYCRCKFCGVRLPIKIFFLQKHNGSCEHLVGSEQSKDTNATATLEAENVMEVDQNSGEDMSIRSDSVTESGDPLPSKRRRIETDAERLLRIFRDSLGNRNDERNHLDIAKDMISSSFDIVSRLRKLDRENESEGTVKQPASNAQPRDTMDLFFDSIVQTMKTLPLDLAAEGKIKIMQIVSDLELRGVQRNVPVASEAADISAQQQSKESQTSTTIEIVANATSHQDASENIVTLVSSTPEPILSPIIDAKTVQPPKSSVPVQLMQSNTESDSTVTSQQQSSEASTSNITNEAGNEVPRKIRCVILDNETNGDTKGNEVLRLVPCGNQNDNSAPPKKYTLLNTANLGLPSGLSNIAGGSTKLNQVNRIGNFTNVKMAPINPQHKQTITNSGIIPVKIGEQGKIINQKQIQGQTQIQQLVQKNNEVQFVAPAPLRELTQNKVQTQIQDNAPMRKTLSIQQNIKTPNKNSPLMQQGQVKIRDQPNEKKPAQIQDTPSMPGRNLLNVRHHPYVFNSAAPPARK